ncbi:MAG: hypothetical protein D6743_05835 [Calditrichaeota bacterium]|nr:MAG: hypothetical protein D6743_05835 [Calditrichota bacterium]
MRSIALSVCVLWLLGQGVPAFGQESAKAGGKSSCVVCHLEAGEELAVPVEGMKHDVHARQGLSCADCHGGDPTVGFEDPDLAMDPAKGYIGAPSRNQIPQFCARCHSDPNYMRRFNPRVATDQYDRYKTSVHGKLLAKGETRVATCVDCHGVHGIRDARDSRSSVYPLNIPQTCGKCHADPDYMKDFGIPTDQVAQYRQSVHGVALLKKGDTAAPACNDCHGNHGATPPGAPSIAYICGQCHLNNSELFLKSPHRAAFEELDLPECETCHGNHDVQPPHDDMLGIGEQSVCVECHEEDSRGYQVAAVMSEQIERLKKKISVADSLVTRAERAGMEVSEAKFHIKDARDALIKTRTIIHSLSDEQTKSTAGKGMTFAEQALEMGQAALAELSFRRRGLAFSVVFILVLAAGLYLKIKVVDQEHPLKDLS